MIFPSENCAKASEGERQARDLISLPSTLPLAGLSTGEHNAMKKYESKRLRMTFGVTHCEKGIRQSSADFPPVDTRYSTNGTLVTSLTCSAITLPGFEKSGRKWILASSYNSRKAARRRFPLSPVSSCPPGNTVAFKYCEPSRAILSTSSSWYEFEPWTGRARITLSSGLTRARRHTMLIG